VTRKTLDIKGQQFISFTLEGREYRHPFLVCPLHTDVAGLLGMDFFEKTGAEINFKCGKMSQTSIKCLGYIAFLPQGKYHSLYFLNVKRDIAHNLVNWETRHKDEQFSASHSS
jgi:hypothetical protein